MIGCYIYGRDIVNKYHCYVNAYSGEDEDNCFSRLSGYGGMRNVAAQVRPEKIYYFNFPATVGRAAVVGRTTLNTAADSQLSDEDKRDTTFEHLYLFDGEDRRKLLAQTDRIFCVGPFCTRPEDVLQEKTGYTGKKTYVYSYNDKRQDVFEDRPETYELEELLRWFGLTGEAFDELLYTLLFSPGRVYLMLPENTKNATDHALALMRKLLGILPAFLAESAGFQTYSNEYANLKTCYVPLGVRYVFLADSEKNRSGAKLCREETKAVFFGLPEPSGVVMRPELAPVVQAMKEQLLNGRQDRVFQKFRALLIANGIPEKAQDVTEDALVAMYQFAQDFSALTDGGSVRSEQEFIRHLNGILEYRGYWSDNLDNNIVTAVTAYLGSGAATEAFYPTLFGLYEKIEGLRGAAADYFAHQVKDRESLLRVNKILADRPQLRDQVLRQLYQDPDCVQAVLKLEFKELQENIIASGKDAKGKAGMLWDLLPALREKNASLPGLADTVDFICGGLGYCTKDCGPAQMKEILEYSVGRVRESGLPDKAKTDYMDGLVQLSEDFIAGLGDVSQLRSEEISLLEAWPQELVRENSALNRMKGGMETEKLLRDFHSKVRAMDLHRILSFLEKLNGDEAEWIARSPEAEKNIESILRTARSLDSRTVKRKELAQWEDVFDRVHVQLADLFPEYTGKIFASVMKAPLGGVVSLHNIYNALRKEWSGSEQEAELEDVQAAMAQAVKEYYSRYEMTRQDRKELKQEESFLDRIGIRAGDL